MFRHVAIFIYGTSGGLTCDVGAEAPPPARKGTGRRGRGVGSRGKRETKGGGEKGQGKKNHEKRFGEMGQEKEGDAKNS